ncbi:MAG: alcohol dehydrogenase catalytic domain-containing protein [bacterium]|nr:alcohol dehydrogenase catalytic domain-containing protein [bacterium]
MTSQTTKALAYFPAEGAVRIIDVPVPSLEADEVLVRITRTAFFRRDRLLLESRDAVLPDGDKFIIPGHIASGRVVEIGSLVRELEPGDLVVPTIRRDCDRCIDARSDLCPHPERYSDSGLKGAHGFARELLVVKSRYLVKIPEYLEDLALLLTPLSIAEKAHHEAVQVNRRYNFYCYHELEGTAPRALVTGMGPVGIMAAFLLSLYNYRLTFFCRRESDDLRSKIFDPLELEYINTCRVPIERLEKAGYTFRQIFETTGDPAYIVRVMPFMAPNAVMVLMGTPEKLSRENLLEMEASYLFSRMVMGNQIMVGSIKAGRDAFDSAVKHLMELADLHHDSLAALMTHSIPLEEYRQLLELTSREAILPVLELT